MEASRGSSCAGIFNLSVNHTSPSKGSVLLFPPTPYSPAAFDSPTMPSALPAATVARILRRSNDGNKNILRPDAAVTLRHIVLCPRKNVDRLRAF